MGKEQNSIYLTEQAKQDIATIKSSLNIHTMNDAVLEALRIAADKVTKERGVFIDRPALKDFIQIMRNNGATEDFISGFIREQTLRIIDEVLKERG